MIPASPWIGSRITAAVSRHRAGQRFGVAERDVREARHQRLKGVAVDSRPDAESAPKVLPWKPPMVRRSPRRPVKRSCALSAPSTASAPELQKKVYCRSPGVTCSEPLGKLGGHGLRSMWLDSGISSSCSLTRATIGGGAVPHAEDARVRRRQSRKRSPSEV
jgi:hypothetical protein